MTLKPARRSGCGCTGVTAFVAKQSSLPTGSAVSLRTSGSTDDLRRRHFRIAHRNQAPAERLRVLSLLILSEARSSLRLPILLGPQPRCASVAAYPSHPRLSELCDEDERPCAGDPALALIGIRRKRPPRRLIPMLSLIGIWNGLVAPWVIRGASLLPWASSVAYASTYRVSRTYSGWIAPHRLLSTPARHRKLTLPWLYGRVVHADPLGSRMFFGRVTTNCGRRFRTTGGSRRRCQASAMWLAPPSRQWTLP